MLCERGEKKEKGMRLEIRKQVVRVQQKTLPK
jgi:hypothetical protein